MSSDAEKSRPKPCDCVVRRKRVAAAVHYEQRQSGHGPREAKMHAAWMFQSAQSRIAIVKCKANARQRLDTTLAFANLRDWYVATSVIQWLATNVGMTVLEAAGFKYQQWTQDMADGELFKRRQEREDNANKSEAKP